MHFPLYSSPIGQGAVNRVQVPHFLTVHPELLESNKGYRVREWAGQAFSRLVTQEVFRFFAPVRANLCL